MWVSKPIYESLPYFYLLSGGLFLLGAMYVNHWYWPSICLAGAAICLGAGAVVLFKRRDQRARERTTVGESRS